MKPIPVSAAGDIAKKYGYDQVIVIARKTGEGGGEHVTTYGVNREHCGVAARIGNFLKHKVMGWPEYEPKSLVFNDATIDKLQEVMAVHRFVVPVRVISDAFRTAMYAASQAKPR
jgi:hypothetical protein